MSNTPGRLRKAGAEALIRLMRPHSPDFIIIGAQKSGTSSLHYYLGQHLEFRGSREKELHYFNRRMHLGETLAEYESNFRSFGKKFHFESTPAYLYHPRALESIKKIYPGIKLIAILRDPVKRAYSAWNHYLLTFGRQRVEQFAQNKMPGHYLYKKFYEGRNAFPSLRECIDIELDLIARGDGFEPALLRRGLYFEQLQGCWKLFGKDSVLILGFSDLITNPRAVLDRVVDFVGARNVGWDFLDPEPKNARPYPVPLNDEDKAFLEEFYREPNRRLFEEIGNINW